LRRGQLLSNARRAEVPCSNLEHARVLIVNSVGPTMARRIDHPELWRTRAEEAHDLADQLRDPESRHIMLKHGTRGERTSRPLMWRVAPRLAKPGGPHMRVSRPDSPYFPVGASRAAHIGLLGSRHDENVSAPTPAKPRDAKQLLVAGHLVDGRSRGSQTAAAAGRTGEVTRCVPFRVGAALMTLWCV
jgi:hypothetical protein